MKFALFASLLNSMYKSVLCLMRRFSDNEKLNAAVAGATSALSLLVDVKDRRIFFALVFFGRSFVSFCPFNNTLMQDTLLNMLQKRGLFHKF